VASSAPVVFIAGPTASGKTDLAIELAKRHAVDLINVDAAQVYRDMDIGTAKLSASERAAFPHALMDIRDPADSYDVSSFVDDASQLIEVAHERGRIPVLVGGSQFYFSALERGVSKLPAADPQIRAEIDREADKLGWAAMHQVLHKIDPTSAEKIKPGDRQRIQRALEIYRLSGQAPSALIAASQPKRLAKSLLKFNLYTPDRSLLHQRIAQRFDAMLDSGLVDEVAALKARDDLHLDLPSMRCVGYRQVWQFLDGELDHQAMREAGIVATRQLAKRQLTWLRHQRGQIWLSSENPNNVDLIQPFFA